MRDTYDAEAGQCICTWPTARSPRLRETAPNVMLDLTATGELGRAPLL